MRVLVTGATGFLGGALCRFLMDQGLDVLATGRSATRCAALGAQGIEAHPMDLAHPIAPDAFGQLDAIVHCAALSAPSGPLKPFQSANVDATRHIVDLARAKGVTRFVNISSPSVYFAPRDQTNVLETHPLPRPFNHYARTKAQAERIALDAAEIGPISLRPRGLYGHGDTSLLPRLLDAAQAHPLPLFRGGRGRIDLTHIHDVCRAIQAALIAPPTAHGQVFNISGGAPMRITDIIDMTCAQAGIQPRWRPMPIRPALAVARLLEHAHTLWPGTKGAPRITAYGLALLGYEQSLNIDKAADLLDWRPQIRFRDGLATLDMPHRSQP